LNTVAAYIFEAIGVMATLAAIFVMLLIATGILRINFTEWDEDEDLR
jgi:hypothetical protein